MGRSSAVALHVAGGARFLRAPGPVASAKPQGSGNPTPSSKACCRRRSRAGKMPTETGPDDRILRARNARPSAFTERLLPMRSRPQDSPCNPSNARSFDLKKVGWTTACPAAGGRTAPRDVGDRAPKISDAGRLLRPAGKRRGSERVSSSAQQNKSRDLAGHTVDPQNNSTFR